MKYVNLGRSGLKVSRLCLGCMSYGEPERLPQPWSLDEKASRPLIRQALEAGINFFDTANIYSGGSSEEITGKALREMARRDEIVVATKTFFPWRNSPNTGFLSRKAIFQSIDDSLMRLGMDYVDLFQIHRFDYSTPVEETMEALHDVVKAGKARYIGASSMEAWRFAKMQHTAERNGWTRFITMQPQYNLLYREEEREMLPLCEDQGVGVIPWGAGANAPDRKIIAPPGSVPLLATINNSRCPGRIARLVDFRVARCPSTGLAVRRCFLSGADIASYPG